MEPITLCGAVILLFGLWVEFESSMRAVVKKVCNIRFIAEGLAQPPVETPVYVRMPICLAKAFHN